MSKARVPLLRICTEVDEALSRGQPVVALESTILAQGLPRPHNLEIGREMEAMVRREGVVPATIAVLDGQAHIGLSETELERICREPCSKAGVGDLAGLLSQRGSAATTVSSTLRLARRAGIQVMATGGIGGVHRESWQTGDVSADLLELSRSGMTVVCSGAKSILDLRLTLEQLETLGVPVVGYQTRTFPAFYSRSSELQLEHWVDNIDQAARLVRAANTLEQPVLLAQPVPIDHEIPWQEICNMVTQAEQEAKRQGVSGKAVTPFLLARLLDLSGGRTLAANRALAVSNCHLAARLSRKLMQQHEG